MKFHHFISIMIVLWSIIGIAVMAYFFSVLRAVAHEVTKIVTLLTVIANKQGATHDDVKEALKSI